MRIGVSRFMRLAACAAVAVAVALAAGCGGSDEPSEGAPTATSEAASTATSDGAPSGTAAAPTGPPIKIGSICSCSGVQASTLAAAGEGIKAWADHVNATGGINGHPVELILEDDGGDPAKSQQAVKKLVEQDKVMAIVANYSFVDATWEKYVEQKGVPVLGSFSVETPFLTSADFFNIGPASPLVHVLNALIYEEMGAKTVASFYCAESPICALSPKIAKLGVTVVGAPIKVLGVKVSTTATDYTAQCVKAKNDGVQALYGSIAGTAFARIMASCQRQGYNPRPFATAQASLPSWATNPAFDGATVVGPTPMFNDESIPAVKEFREALGDYNPDYFESESFTNNALNAWAGGKLFEAVAKAATIGPTSTPADVKEGLYELKGETLGGLTQPLTYTRGQPTAFPCGFVHQVKDGKWVATNGGKPVCASEAQMQKLMSSLKTVLG